MLLAVHNILAEFVGRECLLILANYPLYLTVLYNLDA